MPTIREDGVAYAHTIQVFDENTKTWKRYTPIVETSQEAIEKLLRSNNELLEKLTATVEEMLHEIQERR